MYSHVREINQDNKPKGKVLTQETVEETPKTEVAQMVYHDTKSHLSGLRLVLGLGSVLAFMAGVYIIWLNLL